MNMRNLKGIFYFVTACCLIMGVNAVLSQSWISFFAAVCFLIAQVMIYKKIKKKEM